MLLLLPGFLLARSLGYKFQIEYISVYFVVSTTLLVPIVTLAYILNLKIDYLIIFQIGISLGLLIYLIFKGAFRNISLPKVETLIRVALLALIILAGYKTIGGLFPINEGSDSPYHFAHVRNIVDQGEILNEEAILIMEDEGLVNPGYRDNHWYAVWAMLSDACDSSPREVAKNINPILVLLGMISAVYLTSQLGGKRQTMILTAALYLLTISTLLPLDGVVAFWPNRIGYLIFLPTTTGLFLAHLKSEKRRDKVFYLFAGSMGIAAAGAVHNMAFLFSFIATGAFAGLSVLTQKNKLEMFKMVGIFFVAAAIGFLPLLLDKAKAVSDFSNFVGSVKAIDNTITVGGGYIYTPRFLTSKFYLAAILSGLLTTGYYVIKKIKLPDWVILFLSSLLAVFILRQNPLVAPLLTHLVSNIYMERLVLIIPVVVTVSFAYDFWILNRLSGLKKYLPLLLLAIILLAMPEKFATTPLAKYQSNADYFKDMKGVAAYMNKYAPPKTRLAAEQNSGYAMAGRANVRLIGVVLSHTNSYARGEFQERDSDIRTLFGAQNDNLDVGARTSILDKYDINYVLVPLNNNYVNKNSLYYNGALVEKSLSEDKNLSLVYRDSNYSLYEVRRSHKFTF